MTTPSITARPVAACTSEEVVAALGRGFEGYLVPLRFTAQAYERRFRAENLDPYASRVYEREGAPVGVMLIARRGWTSRVAAMGFAPEVRGQGLGRRFLGEAIAEAEARGDRTMLLEVFEQNPPAVALYTKLGFRAQRRLVGWKWEPGPAAADATETADADDLTEIDPLDFGRLVGRQGEPDLPWALQAETLSAATAPARAWHLAHRAYALVADPTAEKLALAALVVPQPHRRQGWGSRLVQSLTAAFPGRPWSVAPVVPEGLVGDFFIQLGWGVWEIQQIEMRLGARRLLNMNIDSIDPFLDYFERVRERTRRVVLCVPPEQLEWAHKAGAFTFGDLIRHLGAIERWMFAENAQGRPSRYPGHGVELAAGHAAVLAYFDAMHRESLEIFRRLTPEDLARRCETPGGASIAVWKWLRSMVEHEIHHRGQIYLMLGILGIPPPPLYGLTSEEVRERSRPA